jgi:hypothetical protein
MLRTWVVRFAGKHVHVVGEVFPGTRNALHFRLPAELPLGAHLLCNARDFCGKRVELIDHLVDDVFNLQNLAFDVDGDLLSEVAAGDRRGDLRHVAKLHGEIRRHRVHVVGQIVPRSEHPLHVGLPTQLSLGAHLLRDARDFRRKRVELVDHLVDDVFDLEDFSFDIDGHFLGEIAASDRCRDFRYVAQLDGEIRRHRVYVVRQVLPGPVNALDVGLASELTLSAHFLCDTGDLRGERTEGVDHRVDRVFEFEDLAPSVDGNLLRQIAVCDRRGHLRDASHLRGQVRRKAVTLSVKSFHVPETPRTSAWPPSLPSVPTSFATRVTSAAKDES